MDCVTPKDRKDLSPELNETKCDDDDGNDNNNDNESMIMTLMMIMIMITNPIA